MPDEFYGGLDIGTSGERISINNSKKIYNHVHQAPYDIDRIILDKIKWILERI